MPPFKMHLLALHLLYVRSMCGDMGAVWMLREQSALYQA